MKGIMESISSYLYIIVGIAVGLLMIFLIYKYFVVFIERDAAIEGDKAKVSKVLADFIMKCWKNHDMGSDQKSDVCYEKRIKVSEFINESGITANLDCELLPNNDCQPDDCSYCTSPYFDDNNRLSVFIESRDAKISISYIGHTGKIKVFEVAER